MPAGSDITLPLAQVTIEGQAARLQFIGIVSPGLYQINVLVRQGLSSGDQALKVTLLIGPSAPQVVVIPIQQKRRHIALARIVRLRTISCRLVRLHE